MDIAIKTQGLSKKYGSVLAVDNLSFEVGKGEIFGLVGPDGAGKTTTLRMLSTALSPDSGEASIQGFNIVSQSSEVKLRIGYMPQMFSLYGDLTVEENIDFYADLYQVSPDIAAGKKKELLAFSNLESFKKRAADKLSGGMKKKLALACTLIHTPEVLILDEPTTGVDPLSRREFWRILYALIPEVTIVISTPYMDEAERCNRVGLIYDGHLILIDMPEKVLGKFKGEILEVKCERLQQAKKLLEDLPQISGVQLIGDSLHIFLDSIENKKQMVGTFLSSKGIKVFSMKKISPRLEDVFISLLK